MRETKMDGNNDRARYKCNERSKGVDRSETSESGEI